MTKSTKKAKQKKKAATKRAQKAAAVRALERNGKVDPQDLIKVARSPNHPCHDDFTWDDTEAAERWRHHQAKEIIRELKFMVMEGEISFGVVAYVSSPDQDGKFDSLPKIRAAPKVSVVLEAEVNMLFGQACRVHGIALSKVNVIGPKVVAKLRSIRDTLEQIKEELAE